MTSIKHNKIDLEQAKAKRQHIIKSVKKNQKKNLTGFKLDEV